MGETVDPRIPRCIGARCLGMLCRLPISDLTGLGVSGSMWTMPAELLERRGELAVLDAALARAARGRGSTVLVSGEAGIGKTALVRTFVSKVAGRLLSGACEDLLAPRALGALRDAARGPPLAETRAGQGDMNVLLPAVLDELARPPAPAVLIV